MRKQVFQNKTNGQRSRPALLVWLLPLLFYSTFGKVLHNHPLFSPIAASQLVGTEYSQPVAQSQHAMQECFACHWAAHSIALTARHDFRVPQVPLLVTPYVEPRVDFIALIDHDARGPPSYHCSVTPI